MRPVLLGRHFWKTFLLILGLALFAPWDSTAQNAPFPVAEPTVTPAFISWHPHVQYAVLTLNVSVPNGNVLKKEFLPGQPIGVDLFDPQGNRLPNGSYTYELVVTPALAPDVKQLLVEAQKSNSADSVIADLQQQGLLPRDALTQTGYFRVADGQIVLPRAER